MERELVLQLPRMFFLTKRRALRAFISPLIKRVFDVIFSFLVLFFGLPFFLILYFLVRVSSKGPVIYLSKRLGKNGKVFFCYKFRTMHLYAEKRLKDILEKNSNQRKLYEKYHKLKNDPRITTIGKLLRKTSLDELPQLINVLKGNLSIVGPRPYLVEERHKLLENNADILLIKPGLSCIWQICGRSNTAFNIRLQMDSYYVKNRSFALDLYIILKTLPAMIYSKDAY